MSKELQAMNAAYEKFPEMKPYHEMLRGLCFKDVVGLDPREDFEEIAYETGVPWTFQLMFHLQGIVPENIAIHVPFFIIEVHKRLNAGADYSNIFDTIEGMMFIGKRTEKYGNPSYFYILKNKALIVKLSDYGDHLYIFISGYDDFKYYSRPLSEEWPKRADKRLKAAYDAWTSIGGCTHVNNYWNQTICRGNIRKDIEKAKTLIQRIRNYICDNIQLRKDAHGFKEFPDLNILPELE